MTKLPLNDTAKIARVFWSCRDVRPGRHILRQKCRTPSGPSQSGLFTSLCRYIQRSLMITVKKRLIPESVDLFSAKERLSAAFKPVGNWLRSVHSERKWIERRWSQSETIFLSDPGHRIVLARFVWKQLMRNEKHDGVSYMSLRQTFTFKYERGSAKSTNHGLCGLVWKYKISVNNGSVPFQS